MRASSFALDRKRKTSRTFAPYKWTRAECPLHRDRFFMGDGIFGQAVNWIAVLWIAFECVILCMPEVYPVSAENMK